ncbi:hypothetical protein [Streptomyces sp. NPDC006879]|uniref:hypothetical protein n=1 Tax=Streptomyces sp. NPDC006879 TaxID=3364767 RepID=UPI0036BA881B
MRLAWLAWLAHHWNELGYSQGLMRGTIATIAVLITAGLVAMTLQRFRVLALAAAGSVAVAGIGWLALH